MPASSERERHRGPIGKDLTPPEEAGHEARVYNSVMHLARTGESTPRRIAEHTGLHPARVATHLASLRRQGRIIRDGAHYRLAPARPLVTPPRVSTGRPARQLALVMKRAAPSGRWVLLVKANPYWSYQLRDRRGRWTKQIEDLVVYSEANPGGPFRWLPLGRVDAAEAARLPSLFGESLEGYEHGIDNFAVRHMLERHGTGREWRKGQVPLTIEDILRIPEIIAAPDVVKAGGPNRLGRQTIEYRKRVNGYVFYFEEVRTGKGRRRRLAADTMRKIKT